MSWYTVGGKVLIASGGGICDDGGSGGISNGQSITITGGPFGTKSRALAPLQRDTGTGALNSAATANGWTYSYPQGNVTSSTYNLQLQDGTSFNPNSNPSPIGNPNPFVSAIYASASQGLDANTGWLIGPGLRQTLPTLNCATYWCCFAATDASWNPTPHTSTVNWKFCWMTDGDFADASHFNTAGIQQYTNFDAGTPNNSSSSTFQTGINDDMSGGSASSLTNPDANSHGWFWNQAPNPLRAGAPWDLYELESVWSTTNALPASGGGRHTLKINGSVAVNYQGRTYSSSANGTLVLGGFPHSFTNEFGLATNFSYNADHYLDATGGSLASGGQVARVMFRRQSDGKTIGPPSTVTAWSNASITFTFWQGIAVHNDVVLADVYLESGTLLSAYATYTVN